MNSEPMNPAPAIEIEHVSKEYRLRAGGGRSLKGSILEGLKGPRRKGRKLRALDDITLTVARGETLGIIGANGAGKSSLLSLIAGTSQPTSGCIRTKGTLSSLLELGAGFHPDFTGRENVFLYGAMIGLSQQQMRERFDSIVAFAGLESFIDQPVKHYSSGMYVRLGFAVAVEVNPDILLIDEVLAVGDAVFQRRCVEKMEEFRQQGKTMLIISHDLATIQSVSDRILLLDQGRILGIGAPGSVVDQYKALSRERGAQAMAREWGTGEVRITGVTFHDEAGRPAQVFQWGRGVQATIAYEAPARIENPVFGFSVADEKGRVVYGNNTQIEGFDIGAIEGRGALKLHLGPLGLAKGNYLFSFSVHSADHKTNYHRLDNRFPIEVQSEKPFEGCYMPVRWTL